MDYIETIDLPCVAEIQTMGTCLVPPNVAIDRIIIEPRDNPHLGHYRLIMTIDGSLLYSDETPRGRYSIDVDDVQSRGESRNIIAVVVPHDIPSAVRAYLQNESIQITIIGRHEGKSSEEGEIAIVVVDTDCLTDPESCAFDVGFVSEWT
jgi:DNA polymerase elongation subunit (family B)|tara:strand:- start:487 stop:936 length:450 start_codon:yes stop_codon:yes gene_type:complete